jgi:hypothetical protein
MTRSPGALTGALFWEESAMKRRVNMVLESTNVRGISPEGLVLTRSDVEGPNNNKEDARERSNVLRSVQGSYRVGVR